MNEFKLTGTIFRTRFFPENNGKKDFLSLRVNVQDNNQKAFVNAVGFGDVAVEGKDLTEGDYIAIQGPLRNVDKRKNPNALDSHEVVIRKIKKLEQEEVPF